jgi:hypothetical protein
MTNLFPKTVGTAMVLAAALLSPCVTYAGAITGSVSDLMSGGIPNTTVTAFDLDTRAALRDAANRPIEALTDGSGNFNLTVPNAPIGLFFSNRPARVDVTLENINGIKGGTINVFQPEVQGATYQWYQTPTWAPPAHHHHARKLLFWR